MSAYRDDLAAAIARAAGAETCRRLAEAEAQAAKARVVTLETRLRRCTCKPVAAHPEATSWPTLKVFLIIFFALACLDLVPIRMEIQIFALVVALVPTWVSAWQGR